MTSVWTLILTLQIALVACPFCASTISSYDHLLARGLLPSRSMIGYIVAQLVKTLLMFTPFNVSCHILATENRYKDITVPMYYIAGLTSILPSSTQTVEGLAVFTTFRQFQYSLSRVRTIATVANAEAGPVRVTPTSFIGKIITPIHALSILIPPVTYILCVPFNRFAQPAWMQRMSLPDTYFKYENEVGLRVAACAATFMVIRFSARAFTHLGSQWHPIGRREKSRIVQTGPYAVVRHPLYTSALIQGLLFTLMTWSYAPLVGLGITTGASAVKLLVEEDLIMQDPAVAEEYRAYMQRVPARLVPFLW